MQIPTPIHLRNIPWPAEIFDHPQFIANLAKWYRPNLFVEYGVGNGAATSVFAPFCKKVICVDIKKQFIPPSNIDFYEMSTREFKSYLPKLNQPIEMAFIDADHKAEVVFEDFEDLFPYMIENGLLFLHDTFPCNKEFTHPNFCNDSWRVPDMIKKKYGDQCEVLTIPVQPGLTIVRKFSNSFAHLL